jgi:hypothetical protein
VPDDEFTEVLAMAQLRLLLVSLALYQLNMGPEEWQPELWARFRARAERLAAWEAAQQVLAKSFAQVDPSGMRTSDSVAKWSGLLRAFFVQFDFFSGDELKSPRRGSAASAEEVKRSQTGSTATPRTVTPGTSEAPLSRRSFGSDAATPRKFSDVSAHVPGLG